MIDIDRYVDFIIKHRLTPKQFLFLWIVLNRKYPLLYRYCTEVGAFKKGELEDMVEKGYLVNTQPDDENMYADSFEVTDSFKNLIFSHNPAEMFEEFWNVYPNFLFIDSKKIPTKATNKEELEEKYIKLIKDNIPLHNTIINAIDWGKSRGYLNTGIIKFFTSEAWTVLHGEMKESMENGELPTEYQF